MISKFTRYPGASFAENSVSAKPSGAETRISELVKLFGDRKTAAEIAQVSVAQLHRYMTGQSQPPFGAVARMAVDRGVNMEWVWTGSGPIYTQRIEEVKESAAAYAAAIDWDVMKKAIGTLDVLVERRDLDVTPQWKADMTRLLYKYFKDQGGQEEGLSAADRATLMEIIDTALQVGAISDGESNGRRD